MRFFLKNSGFTMVESLVVASVSVIIFGSLMLAYMYSLELVSVSRSKLSALSAANQRMEYFRSLPYDSVGTILGIPSGLIPQNSTTTLNGIEFHERVLVEYVDDDADGQGAADGNAIVSDYKRVKLEYTWKIGEETYDLMLVSDVIPRSVETSAGGGTVRVNVLDADASPLSGANVRLFNTVVGPVDVTRFSDVSGTALFSGAATGSDYQVVVTANIGGQQYSTAQTYVATTSNPNPIVSPFSVLEADVSTLTFQIGELSDLDVLTWSSLTEGSFSETFVDLTAISSSSAVAAVGGNLVLQDTVGVYETIGVAYLGPIAPVPLSRWQTLRIAAVSSANTAYRVQLFTGAFPGPFILIPDVDLPGNAAGFTDTIIDISSLDQGVYPSVIVGVTLETSDTAVTPSVDEVSVFYRQSGTALADAAFTMHGNKIIGTNASAQPIYKYDISSSTDASGELTIIDLEFDDFTFAFGGHDIAMACGGHPFVQQAGVDGEFETVLVPDAADTLRVTVVDMSGRTIPGADVRLTRIGYDVTIATDSCGQAFFTGGVSANSDYTIEVATTGYVNNTVNSFTISEDTATTIILSE
ncbi:MAG: carboxypeptidase regulatory-like domain-containing protein [Candidatus Pacebacteria bacterium]|nr:carboxypeptidase regulatory-like domain-containing protein [Candidatus Paceibacterota bacterium]